jgi:hypothetical protein
MVPGRMRTRNALLIPEPRTYLTGGGMGGGFFKINYLINEKSKSLLIYFPATR